MMVSTVDSKLGRQMFSGDIARLADPLVKGWRLVAASVAVCLTLGMVHIASAERMYQATARLLVLQQGSRPLSVATGDSGRVVDGADDFLPTHAVVVRSPLVVSRAIESVGLNNLAWLRGKKNGGHDPVLVAIDHLSVSRPDRSAKVLRIDYQAGDRNEAVRMVQAIAESYRAFLDSSYRNTNNQVVTLVSKARDEMKVEMEELEAKYVEFRRKKMVLTTDDSGRSFLTRRLDHWDRAANGAMVREVQLRSQLDLSRKLAESGTGLWAVTYALSQFGGESGAGLVAQAAPASHSAAADYVRQLSTEQQQLAERYGPQYAKVKELQEQVARVQERMRDARNRLDRVETQDLLNSLEQSLKSVGAMRQEFVKRFEGDLGEAKQAESDLLTETNLRANLERQRALFNSVVDQLKQAQLTSDYTSISSQTIEPANALANPVRPRTVTTLLLSLLAGCLLGAGVALVSDRLDSRIRTMEDVRHALSFTILGQIPVLTNAPGEQSEAGLVSHVSPRSPASEAYKMVRTNLELLRRGRQFQVILVTSPHSGDGKSITASNVAISLAQAGRRVLLVDADLRRPTQDRVHKLPRNPGLSHVLRDILPIQFVIQRSTVEDLDLITAGPEVTGPAELLGSVRFREFLEEVKQSYDLVIVDSPPLLAVSDATVIGTAVDGIVLVVRGTSFKHRDAGRVVEMLANLGTPVLGTVINCINTQKNAYSYGYDSSPSVEGGGAAVAAKPATARAGSANGRAAAHDAITPKGAGDETA